MVIDTNTIVMLSGVITSVAAAAAVITKTIKKWSDKLTDKVKADVKKEVGEDMNKLREEIAQEYKATIDEFSNKLDLVVASLDETREYRNKKESDEKNFRLATLKGLIVSSHGTYVPLGKIDTHVLSTLEDIFDEYTELGGNHFVQNLMEDLRNLQKI